MKQKSFPNQLGFTLLEVLISLIILLIGLLGLAGLIMNVQKADLDSYQRRQATIILQDMVNRMNANRRVSSCYAITTDTTNGAPYLGSGYSGTPICVAGSSGEPERAIADLGDWDNILKGASETYGGNNTGALISARGCITTVATGIYRVSIAWQGVADTSAPPSGSNCAKGLYGSELRRRVVSAIVSIPNLNS